MVGKSTGTESDLQGIEREHSGWSVEGRTKKKKKKRKENCACGPWQRLAHPSQSHVSLAADGG